MTIMLGGKRWRLHFVHHIAADGDCDPPDVPHKRIRIAMRLRGQRRLAVLIHEMLHATHWSLDEDWVDQISTDMARVLWKLGYRV